MESFQIVSKEELQELSPEQLVSLSDRLEWEEERRKVRTDLLYLCENYLGYKGILNKKLHGEVIVELNKQLAKNRRALFLLPRIHLKTSLITIAWVIQQILINQDITVLILNSVYGNAVKFVKTIQQYLLDEKLINLFPEILCPTFKDYQQLRLSWSENVVNVKRTKVVRGNTVEAFGLDSALTSLHADLIILDDLQDDKNSVSVNAINNVIEVYKNCGSVLNPKGRMVILGTRWAREDFYNHLIKKLGYTAYEKSATVDKKGKRCKVNDPDARPIYPELHSIESLKEKWKEDGPYFYSCQYENNPLPDEDVVFKEAWFEDYEIGKEPEFQRIYLLIDPALGQTRKADDSVISVVAQPLDKKLPLYCIKSLSIGYVQTKGEETVQKLINKIFEEYIYWSVSHEVTVGIESAQFQSVLKQWVEKQQRDLGLYFKVVDLKTSNRTKDLRIRRLQPLFENRGILLNPSACQKLKEQLLDYPATKHDDHPDALAYIMDVLPQTLDTIRVLEIGERNTNGFDDDIFEPERSWLSY